MAISWRRMALPAAALGILVPVGFGAQALLSSSDGSDGAAATDPGASAAPAFAGADAPETDAVVADRTGSPAPSAHPAAVRLASYDPQGKRAVLRTSSAQTVRTGDVIASAPSRLAPRGALFKVAKVDGTGRDGLRVTTAPATITELLGDQRADARAVLTSGELRVRPLAKGVTTMGDPAPAGSAQPSGSPSAQGTASPSASAASPAVTESASARPAPSSGVRDQAALRIDAVPAAPPSPALPPGAVKKITTLRLGLDVPLPADVAATPTAPARLGGEIRFSPELVFAYEKRGGLNVLPEKAAVGLGGSYGYDWHVHGSVRRSADTGEIATPLASVTGQHTFWIGPVPVVVNAEVVFTYRFTADGRIALDAEQHTSGSFAVGARYERAQGWQPVRQAQQQTDGGTPRIEGAATAKASVGTRAKVALYDTAGVSGDLSVYLKGRAAAGNRRSPAWELDAGYDLRTQLALELKIFGISIVDLRTTPFAAHDERRLYGQGTLPPA